ncbi:MAG: DUF4153 domain-containing protein [Marinomonas atlantica]|nr:DUF4153 domain-containing protein [Marinomonas atlantica]
MIQQLFIHLEGSLEITISLFDAYFIKILITGEVPNGHLAYMICGFIGAAIVTYLFAHPLREQSSAQLRLFYRILFPAMIVPIGFHFYAIWERVSAYGITESRYMLGISALWFAFLATAGTLKRLPLRAIPMSLAVLMLIATVGPWSAVSVSGLSQKARLEALLIENNILVNEKIVTPSIKPNFEVRKNISSILAYMCRTKRSELIEVWFEPNKQINFQCDEYALTEEMGFEFVYYYNEAADENRFDLYSQSNGYKDISGYDHLIEGAYLFKNTNKFEQYKLTFGDGETLTASFVAPYLNVVVANMDPIEVDLTALLQRLLALETESSQYQDMEFRGENQDISYRFEFTGLSGAMHGDNIDISNINFDFYYKLKQ